MPTVLLTGAFGQGNPGDEALCRAFRDALPDARLIVATADPERTAAAHACEAVRATPASVAAALRHSDHLVVGGGTVFKALHPASGRRRNALLRSAAALVTAASLRGVPVAMVGVGADELRGVEARRLAALLVRRTDLLVLRDEESADVLTRAGAPAPFRVGADAAWTILDPPPAPSERAREDRVTVAVSHLAGGRPLVAALGDALRELPGATTVRLQPWQTGTSTNDLAMADALRRRIGDRAVVIDAPADLVDARRTFLDDRLVVALRFHAAVAAGAAGTGFLAVAHEPKLVGLARRLGQPALPAHAPLGVVHHALAIALDQTPATAAVVRREMARAEEGMALLRLLVDGGRLDDPAELVGLPLSSGRVVA